MLIRLFIDQTTFRITKWFLLLFSSELRGVAFLDYSRHRVSAREAFSIFREHG